jgi:hypothetical protein
MFMNKIKITMLLQKNQGYHKLCDSLDLRIKPWHQPCVGILPHIGGKPLHIPGSDHFHVVHILHRMHHKRQRRFDKVVLRFVRRCSLLVPQHNKLLHTPCLTEYSAPSFLHHLPADMLMHNDCKLLHNVNMCLHSFDKNGNLS